MRGSRASARADGRQALPLALGGCFVLIAGALALVAIAGAVTGKGRVQRGGDLAAISAARSMRDDLPRLLSPPTLPNGLPNPAHMEKAVYLWRARAAAHLAARANGVGVARLRVSFPDAISFAPVRAKATVLGELDGRAAAAVRSIASAVAEAAAPALRPAPSGRCRRWPSGGGYSGPLVYRNGEGMRPDVAAAFDRMAAAASAGGGDPAGQLRLPLRRRAGGAVRRQPRPRMGRAARASRCTAARPSSTSAPNRPTAGSPPTPRGFGFVQRYSWEPWHYGFDAGPQPCSEAGDAVAPRAGGAGAGETGRSPAAPACRASSRPASGRRCCAPRRAGTSPPRCSPRS